MKPRTHTFAAALLLLAFCAAGAAAQSGPTKTRARDAHPLRLTGEVLEVKLDEEEETSIEFSFKVRLKFTNEGEEPVILLSEEANKPWMGGVRLSRSREDAAAGRFLFDRSAWPSNYRTGDPDRKWERLTESLDMPFPPSDLTRVIPPGGSWDYEKESRLYITKEPGSTSGNATWEEIRRASPLWLTVTFEMWPTNVEPDLDYENAFGKRLRRSWKSYGTLWLDNLKSEPLELRLPEAATRGDGR